MIIWRCFFCFLFFGGNFGVFEDIGKQFCIFYYPWYCSPETFLYVRLDKLVHEKKAVNFISNKR